MTKREKPFEGYKPNFLSAYGNARDWQKDMQRVKDYEYSKTLVNVPVFLQIPDYEPDIEILGYWLQQYANESEKKDQYWAWYQDEEKRANDAELQLAAERERAEKAEELLKIILPYVPNTVRDTYDIDALLAVLDL